MINECRLNVVFLTVVLRTRHHGAVIGHTIEGFSYFKHNRMFIYPNIGLVFPSLVPRAQILGYVNQYIGEHPPVHYHHTITSKRNISRIFS